MKIKEFTGKTTKEAIDNGLAELGVTIADVHVDVLQEGAKGLFGLFGSKPACVRLTVMDDEREDDHGLSDLLGSFSLSDQKKKSAAKPAAPKPAPAKPAAPKFPATALRVTSVLLLGLAAFLGIGIWGGVPSERLFSGVFTLLFAAGAGFILYKVNQRQPRLSKGVCILYIVLGVLLILAGILVLLTLGEEVPPEAADYWFIGCTLLGGDVLLGRVLRQKKGVQKK